jgi:hypothetical protein
VIDNGYLPLADAGLYVRPGRSREAAARWARRHLLPNVPHIHPPETGIMFCKTDIDKYLAQFRVDPQEALDRAVREATAFIREAQKRDREGRYTRKGEEAG